MKKILLTNPTLENERDVTDPLIPLGMPSVAAYLRQNLDEELKFDYVNQKFPEKFKSYKPDIVFMTTMSPYYHKATSVARKFKEIDESVPIVVGGFHISILPRTLSPHMDVGVVGEGELTSLELFPHIDNPNKKIKGIVYRDKGEIVVTEPRQLIHDLDILPFPARDIMKDMIHKDNFTSLISARGCPFSCAFCANSAFWGGIRFFGANHVVDEVEHIVEKHTNRINFVDDAFTVNKPRLRKIVDMLVERGIEIEVYANGRADLLDDEMCSLVKRIGIKDLCFGLESGCQKTLDYLKEGRIKVDYNYRALDLCKKHGIHVTASTVIFNPDETYEELMMTRDMIKDPRVNYAVANVLVPLPGTPVWDEALKRGLVEERWDWEWGRLTFAFPYYSEENFKNLVVLSNHFTIDEMWDIWSEHFKVITQDKTLRWKIREGVRHPIQALKYVVNRLKWKLGV